MFDKKWIKQLYCERSMVAALRQGMEVTYYTTNKEEAIELFTRLLSKYPNLMIENAPALMILEEENQD